MGKHFFDYDDGDFAYTISDNMAIDSGGHLMMHMCDNMASSNARQSRLPYCRK